jgi:hypothetical protein
VTRGRLRGALVKLRKRARLLATGVTLGAVLVFAAAGTAAPTGGGMAVGVFEYPTNGTVSGSVVGRGTPAAADGVLVYRSVEPGVPDVNAIGRITCYLQVGIRGYFSGMFIRPFSLFCTEIRFFTGEVVDRTPDGSLDEAFVMLRASEPIPCDTENLDAAATPITRGNIFVHQ